MKVCPKCGTQYGDDANFCTADAGRLVAMAAPAAAATPAAASGLLGGRFQLGARVGGGDTGAVHRATDTQTGATVAVKLIAPAVLQPVAQGQRVERELKLLERVQTPLVARVIASGKQGDQVWVASEWIDGGLPLTAQVEAGLVDADRAAELVGTIGAALLDAAKVGLVHRDLSPRNVLISGDAVKLINFAVATPGEKVAGAPGFVAPEAIEGKPIDQRSTTYSLGAVAYFLLTGQPPFVGDAAAVHAATLAGQVPPPSAHGIGTSFDAVIGRAMDRNPARRYLTLKQFLDDVTKAAAGGPDPATTAPFGRVGKSVPIARVSQPIAPIVEVPAPVAASVPVGLATVVDDGGRGSSRPAIQAPSAPPVATTPSPMAALAHNDLDDMLTVRTPTLIPEEVHGGVPSVVGDQPASPWASPAPAVAAAHGDVGPTTAAVQSMARPAPASEPAAAQPAAAAAAPTQPIAAEPTAPKQARARTASAPPGATGKKKPAEQRKANKGKFRETQWFKKGDLDAAAAAEAAKNTDGSAQDKADTLPMEERYLDDGTVTSADHDKYSLKTGQTSSMPSFKEGQSGALGPGLDEDDLVGEMKAGRKKYLIAIALGVVVIVAVVLAFAL